MEATKGGMVVHAYPEGCGFNATIPGTGGLWRSRYPMNAHELRVWVERQRPEVITFSGDTTEARVALGESA